MAEGKRHLPIVGAGGAPTPAPSEPREWPWAGICALVVSALSILLLPLVLRLALGAGAAGDELPDRLRRLSPEAARAALVRLAIGCAAVSAVAAFATGVLSGRMKKTRSRLEAIVGMVFAALVWAFVARRAWAIFVFAPPMAFFAWAGARVGRRLRARADAARPPAPAD